MADEIGTNLAENQQDTPAQQNVNISEDSIKHMKKTSFHLKNQNNGLVKD